MEEVGEHTEIARQLERRRSAAAGEWNLTDEVVLIGAGEMIPVPGRGDRTYPFYAHSEYYYLTDRNRPGGVLAFDPREGWFDFVAPITEDDRLWSGAPIEEQEGLTTSALGAWLASRAKRPVAWLGVAHTEPQTSSALVDDLRAVGEAVRPTRGPGRLCTWKQANRILAGFGDGQAADGPSAGPASLVGLKLAKERGWKAPEGAK